MKRIVIIVFGVLSTARAEAAPWVREPGETYARLAFSHTLTDQALVWQADIYAEYGVSKTLTLTFKQETTGAPQPVSEPLTSWQVGARQRLYQWQGLTASVETRAFQSQPLKRAPDNCQNTGFEVRSGLAWSGQIVQQPIYVYGETAWRSTPDCTLRRFDFGLGTQIYDSLWGHIELWQGRRNRFWQSDKLQAELVWRSETLAYSLGYRTELNAAYEENGVLLAIARTW